jgi:hypothetical protein
MRINVKPIIPIVDMNMIQSLLYMLDACLNDKNIEGPDGVETVFVYCAVWAFGSALTVSDDGTDYKKLFSDWCVEWLTSLRMHVCLRASSWPPSVAADLICST